MKTTYDVTSLTPKIDITVFQALTLLKEKYLDNSVRYHEIESIYLTGVRGKPAEYMLNELLDDPLLANYHVSDNKKDINNDPVRRYFESHLCHNTLKTSLDNLDAELLEDHYQAILGRIPEEDQAILIPMIEGRVSPSKPNEYSEGLAKLSKSDSYQSLQPQETPGNETSGRETPADILNARKDKLRLIAQCMYAAFYVDEALPSGEVPLDIYSRPGSAYDEENRGRIERVDIDALEDACEYGKNYDESKISQTVRSHNLGIMRSFMPLPTGDALLAEELSTSLRPADRFTYAAGSYAVPNKIFSNKVTPFVSSISGTMLIKLRVIAQLLRENNFVFNTPFSPRNQRNIKNQQLELFLKTFIAYMLYNAGGHSLDEYLQVLDQYIVQQEFRDLAGFSGLTLINLFQKDNAEAFDKTVTQTIAYNKHIISKKRLFAELETNHNVRVIVQKELQNLSNVRNAHRSIIGTINLNIPHKHTVYTILDSSIIGGAFLFALIRLLNNTQPANKKNDLLPRLQQLFLVICTLAIAHTVHAKIIKQEKRSLSLQEDTNYQAASLSAFVSTATSKILDYSIFKAPDKHQNKNTQSVTQPKAPNTY